MKRLIIAAAAIALLASSAPSNAVDSTLMPTWQRISPGGETFEFKGRALALEVSAQGLVAIKHSHGILFLDPAIRKVVQNLELTREHVHYPENLGGNGMTGIAWSRDGRTVWSSDGFGLLRSASRREDGTFAWDPDVELPGPSGHFRDPKSHELDPSAPAGVAVDDERGVVYVALTRRDVVAAVDIKSRAITKTITTGAVPFALALHGRTLYVTNLGGPQARPGQPSADSGGQRIATDARGIVAAGSVSAIDLDTGRQQKQVIVGLEPVALAFSPDGARLYVANSASDSISIIDTAKQSLVQTKALPQQAGFGAAPNALAVLPWGGNLFVSEGGDNRVLVLNPGLSEVKEQIATGWYPSAIGFAGHSLVIGSLKGIGSRSGPNVYDYSGLIQIAIGGRKPTSSAASFAQPRDSGRLPPFKHVVYIIKENRTYDDVFGDLRGANGALKYCVYPEQVTPNHHALARRFGAFDNFYVMGTMSADGHQWTDSADANDYVERNTASWARTYPSDGTDPLAFASTGFIWQRLLAAGLTFRDYGEFATSGMRFTPAGATWQQVYDDRRLHRHTVTFQNDVQMKSLRPYVDMRYPGFSLRVTDQARADEFLREFRGYERSGTLPNLILMQLPNDHTSGDDAGYPKPDSAVADNDLALGRIVDAISHSRYWLDTAIFVVEDDAQDGQDHVDPHRTAALVISAYSRPHTVDSRFYNQASILRTIENIFGLQPLTQFDAQAPLIVAPFQSQANLQAYSALPARVRLDELNPTRTGFFKPDPALDVPDQAFDGGSSRGGAGFAVERLPL